MALLEELKRLAASDQLPLHMPGHKRSCVEAPYLATLGGGLDITEITGFDDLYHPEGLLQDTMTKASTLWGTAQTLLLVGGSTVGILTAIHAATKAGDLVIMARGCHRAVYHAVLLCGLRPVYLAQERTAEGYCLPVTAETVQQALCDHPDCQLVILTSPTYEGFLADIPAIATVCHRQDIPLFVDEAHGAHLDLSSAFVGGAVRGGADLVVQSLHKTLPSLTQTAVLHRATERVSGEALAGSLTLFQTSSPSYLLLASIDSCIDLLLADSERLCHDWQARLQMVQSSCRSLKHLQLKSSVGMDPTKLLLSTVGANCDGPTLKRRLREEYHIELEMACGQFALGMTGIGDTEEGMARLVTALCAIDETLQPTTHRTAPHPLPIPPMRYAVAEVRGKRWEQVALEKAVGRISASMVYPYPPGIPLLVPGEEITKEVYDDLVQLQQQGVAVQDDRGALPNSLCVLL